VNDSGGVKNWSKVESLFHAALALPLSERADFLKQACQGDAELLQEAQTLLARAETSNSFLETSPLSFNAQTAILSPGVTLGNFEIEALLGEGGMGEVYRARDTRLDRIVAIKRSRQQFSSNVQSEARAVAALNHPHICILHDIGPDYLVMEFIDGETLQSRLARGPLPLDSAVPLAIQLLDALETAHGKGIVHRDLKPANIMLSGSNLKVLDFGLARMEPPGVQAGSIETRTDSDVIMGTVPYMAPEQLQGKKVDARSDIFSFGLVLYEMLTGRRAFGSANRADLIVAILTAEPDMADVPAPLAPVIRKCIAKQPGDRWESAAAVREELARISATPASRRISVYALAALGLAVAAAAFLFFRPHPQPLTDKDVIVVADFTNTTGDPVFTGTLRQALAIQLEQSPFLKILDDDIMRRDLRTMGKSAATSFTNPIAREVCQRESDKAMISGSIASVGKSFVIDVVASACQTGQTLAHEQLEAEDKEHVLRTVARVAANLRGKLGESLATIPKPTALEANATTTSLEALQSVTIAAQLAGTEGPRAAIPFLERALQFDPNFAAAYEKLAIQYAHLSDLKKEGECYTKAFGLTRGLPERERLRISAGYYWRAQGDLNKTIEITRLHERLYPRDAGPHNILGAALSRRGDLEGALAEVKQASELNPQAASFRSNLLSDQMALGQFDLARSTANDALAHHLNAALFHKSLLLVGLSQGNDAAVQAEVRWFQQKNKSEDILEALGWQASARGRLREALDDWRRAEALWDKTINQALAGSCDIPPAQTVSNSLTAIGAALCGRVSSEHVWTTELSEHMPIGTLWKEVYYPSIKAAGALHRADAKKALEELHMAPGYDRSFVYVPYFRGQALLLQMNGAGAEAEFRKLTDHVGAAWDLSCPQLNTLSRLGLARAQAMSGDKENARISYKQLLEYWKDADSDYKPAIEASREYLALLKQ
jgi:tetratricopeptide (TPR) repeat protein/predicted Ser/Thr protein kinase